MRTKTIQKELRKYLLEGINNNGEYFANEKEAIKYFFEMFEAEYGSAYNKHLYPLLSSRISEYLKGLPSCIDVAFSDYDIICTVEAWNGKPLTEKEKAIAVERWFGWCGEVLTSMK